MPASQELRLQQIEFLIELLPYCLHMALHLLVHSVAKFDLLKQLLGLFSAGSGHEQLGHFLLAGVDDDCQLRDGFVDGQQELLVISMHSAD